MIKVPERNKGYIKGLNNFIDWIDNQTPVKDLTILEIGAWTGAGSVTFAKRFKEVHCIDAWKKDKRDDLTMKFNIEKAEEIFDKRKKEYKNISKYKGDWKNFVSSFNKKKQKFDVIYVDMNKKYQDNIDCWIAYYSMANKYVSGHDYEKRFPEVVKAVNKMFGKPQAVFMDTSWIIKLNI
jgi:hypothetical protein